MSARTIIRKKTKGNMNDININVLGDITKQEIDKLFSNIRCFDQILLYLSNSNQLITNT